MMKSEDGKKAEVNLYGEIVEAVPTDWWTGEKIDGLFIEGKQFLADLDTLDEADEVIFHINSVGGDVEMGISIYNRIKAMSAATTTVVDGLAASAASIIAQAGDIRQISTGAQIMIHGASAGLIGYYNVEDLKKTINMLSSINESVASIYALRAEKDAERIVAMMAKEKWMTAEEALSEGFVDEISGAEPEVESVKNSANTLIINGVLQNLRGLPMPEMTTRGEITISRGKEGSHDIESPKNEEGRKKAMTLQELMDSQPELVEQIRNEAATALMETNSEATKAAVEAERVRLKEIDSIAQAVGNPELVNRAKYEEPMNAAELALAAMQAQQAQGDAFLAAREKETENAREITGAGNSGMEDTVAQDEARLNALINSLKEEI